MFLPVIVDIFKDSCVFIIFAAAVYFQFYAKISFSSAIENRVRLVAVVLNFVVITNIIIAIVIRLDNSSSQKFYNIEDKNIIKTGLNLQRKSNK